MSLVLNRDLLLQDTLILSVSTFTTRTSRFPGWGSSTLIVVFVGSWKDFNKLFPEFF